MEWGVKSYSEILRERQLAKKPPQQITCTISPVDGDSPKHEPGPNGDSLRKPIKRSVSPIMFTTSPDTKKAKIEIDEQKVVREKRLRPDTKKAKIETVEQKVVREKRLRRPTKMIWSSRHKSPPRTAPLVISRRSSPPAPPETNTRKLNIKKSANVAPSPVRPAFMTAQPSKPTENVAKQPVQSTVSIVNCPVNKEKKVIDAKSIVDTTKTVNTSKVPTTPDSTSGRRRSGSRKRSLSK